MDVATTPSASASRTRGYRPRRKNGVRCFRIRFNEPAILALVDEGFSRGDETSDNAAVERSVCELLNAWRQRDVSHGVSVRRPLTPNLY
jgi:hypothetical protein